MSQSFDVVVIGSGPGGYVAAIRAAQLGLKIACIEKHKELGGTCLNVGCIPSKTLLHSSELYWKFLHEGPSQGIDADNIRYDFSKMMARKQKVVKTFNEGVGLLFKKNKITHLSGAARLVSATTIEVTNGASKEIISARYIILATGSEPIPLSFLPFDEKRIISSTGALALSQVPKTLIVIGAGVIGVELGSVYKRLGTEVTFVEFMDKICPTLDEAISKEFQKILTSQGMKFHLSSKVISGNAQGKNIQLQVEMPSGEKAMLEAETVLVCIGRRPFTQGLGLAEIGIKTDQKGFIPIDGRFRTQIANIFAIGDIVNGPMLAHKAMEEGVAVAEIIAGKNPQIDYIAIPNVVYTHPEVAAVGLTEIEAKQAGFNVAAGTFPLKINSRAECTGEDEGLVKVIAEAATDRILGIHIIGARASDMIGECVLAMQKKLTALELGNLVHAHPTFSEAIKEAALAVHKRTIHK